MGDRARNSDGLHLLALAYVVPFLAVLTIIVFVHEMGHYLVAAGMASPSRPSRSASALNCSASTTARHALAPVGHPAGRLCPLRRRHERIERAGRGIHRQGRPGSARAALRQQERLAANRGRGRRSIANIILTFLVLYALLLGYGRYTLPPVIGSAVVASLWPLGRLEAWRPRSSRWTASKSAAFEDFQRLVSTAPGAHGDHCARPRTAQTLTMPADRQRPADHRPLR